MVRGACLGVTLAMILCVPFSWGAVAQPTAAPAVPNAAVPKKLRGKVILGSSVRDRGLAGQRVVLHRVSQAASGPLDSVTTRSDGSFALTFRPTADGLYLLSVRYAGIGYFSAPINDADEAVIPDAEIVVYDTSSTARVAALRGRHLIVSAPGAGGVRTAVEVFELANDTSVTMVSAADSSPVWRLRLPPAAQGPRMGESEFAAEAVRFAGGEVQLFAPLAPGLKQLVVSYELPPSAFPLSLPMEPASTVMEVLLEETGGNATGAGLTVQPAVTVGGRRFQRALAQDAGSGAVVAISLPDVNVVASGAGVWIVVLAVPALALGAWVVAAPRRRLRTSALKSPGAHAPEFAPAVTPPAARSTESLARRVATLDALLAQPHGLDAPARARLVGERARVIEELREALSPDVAAT
jgi:hypothetical protein